MLHLENQYKENMYNLANPQLWCSLCKYHKNVCICFI